MSLIGVSFLLWSCSHRGADDDLLYETDRPLAVSSALLLPDGLQDLLSPLISSSLLLSAAGRWRVAHLCESSVAPADRPELCAAGLDFH